MTSSGHEASSRSFLELLDEQYAMVEEYANAQTLLFNAAANPSAKSASETEEFDEFAPSKPPTVVALERLEEAKWKLRYNFLDLKDASVSKLHTNHLSLSERVVTTIYMNPTWHANGLPNDAGRTSFAQSALEVNTVAIAALNASIARIKDIEDSP